jgi:hypothetical protein
MPLIATSKRPCAGHRPGQANWCGRTPADTKMRTGRAPTRCPHRQMPLASRLNERNRCGRAEAPASPARVQDRARDPADVSQGSHQAVMLRPEPWLSFGFLSSITTAAVSSRNGVNRYNAANCRSLVASMRRARPRPAGRRTVRRPAYPFVVPALSMSGETIWLAKNACVATGSGRVIRQYRHCCRTTAPRAASRIGAPGVLRRPPRA